LLTFGAADRSLSQLIFFLKYPVDHVQDDGVEGGRGAALLGQSGDGLLGLVGHDAARLRFALLGLRRLLRPPSSLHRLGRY